MAEKETMNAEECRKYERECWDEIKVAVKKTIEHCSHKDCNYCKDLKTDLGVIGDMVKFLTKKDEPEEGTTA
jgi:hypothetical protein